MGRAYTFKRVAGAADDGQCIYSVSANQEIQYQKPGLTHLDYFDPYGGTVTDWEITTTNWSMPTEVAGFPVNGVNIARQTSLELIPTDPAHSSSLGGPITAPTQSTQPVTSVASRSPPSVKIVAAIGAASGLAVLFLMGIFVWFLLAYRRRTAARKISVAKDDDFGLTWPPELRRELHGQDSRFEMEDNRKRIELSCNEGLAHELDNPRQTLELESNRPPAHELYAQRKAGVRTPRISLRVPERAESRITPANVVSPL